jgi:hypothetical protein
MVASCRPTGISGVPLLRKGAYAAQLVWSVVVLDRRVASPFQDLTYCTA